MGSLDGVYATTAAWRDGREIVSLLFDPEEIDYKTLVKEAKNFKCTDKVFTHSQEHLKVANEIVGSRAVMATDEQRARFAKDSDQKYYLANSPLRTLPMCGYQITKVNAAIGRNERFDTLLSPRQITLAKQILAKQKTDKGALSGLNPPVEDDKLGAYTAKLEKALAK